MPITDTISSLYVHVPFCAHKCEYCAFYSETPKEGLLDRYTSALIREMEIVAQDLAPQTVFFGGGTPSLLNMKQWARILEAMERLNLLGASEWTVECNPATVSLDKARLLRSFGVNRISMGVQSLDESLLDRLGRVHSRAMVFKSYDILRSAGFENVNLDFMFAIPSQTMEMWRDTLREAIAMQSDHLSCYEVTYEEDTPMFHQLNAGEIEVDEELACEMYDELVRTALEHGFQPYEVSNFGKSKDRPSLEAPEIPARACRHNVNYWRGGSCYGVGPAATGYVRGIRSRNWANTQLYCEQLEKGRRAIESSEELPPLARAGETAAFGLRMQCGWGFDEFLARTGFDLRNEWSENMEELCDRGWAAQTDGLFRLTPTGMRFADAAGEMFLRPEGVLENSRRIREHC